MSSIWFWVTVIALVLFFTFAGWKVRGRTGGSTARDARYRSTEKYPG